MRALYRIDKPSALARFTSMSGAELGLAASVFLASAVECVEALTIVLAVGSTRSWPSALSGAGSAFVLLAALIAALGAGLGQLPVEELRLVVGLLLLAFGAQWLRKAVLREAGRKAMRDESAAFARESEAALEAGATHGRWDPYSFTIAFKGVAIEGLEVALIVVTLGANHHDTGLAAAAAGLAAITVAGAGLLARHPLARVPENALKYAVGVMLCSFGIFWAAEGAGLSWPGGEAMLLAIVALVLAFSLAAVAALRRSAPARGPAPP
jgi:uncharacterized membrane protein